MHPTEAGRQHFPQETSDDMKFRIAVRRKGQNGILHFENGPDAPIFPQAGAENSELGIPHTVVARTEDDVLAILTNGNSW